MTPLTDGFPTTSRRKVDADPALVKEYTETLLGANPGQGLDILTSDAEGERDLRRVLSKYAREVGKADGLSIATKVVVNKDTGERTGFLVRVEG